MERYNERALDELYDSIESRSLPALLAGGTPDTYLASAAADKRMSLALVFRPSPEITSTIIGRLQQLHTAETGLYCYPAQDLHVTVMDILKGVYGRVVPDELAQYIQCIKECAQQIQAFHVVFDGWTASDSAVMAKGYYEAELEHFRVLLRHALADRGLPLEERYQTVSCHVTAARMAGKLHDPESFIAFLSKPAPFGCMKVDCFDLVFHNWYDSQKTVLAKFPL